MATLAQVDLLPSEVAELGRKVARVRVTMRVFRAGGEWVTEDMQVFGTWTSVLECHII